MKDRIVIWGQDEKDTDVLIAIRLLQDSDIIKIWTFPKKEIDTAFVDGLFKEWKDGAEDNFPQPFTLIERGITEENMLPEGLKTPKTDVVKIAEQEWRVRVLSFRLYEHIKQQIEQLKVRVGNLSIFSKDVWEEAKDVSRSIKENTLDRNIKREQTTELRKGIDEVFEKLKKLQNAEQAKFQETSKNNLVNIRTTVSEVLEKIGVERNTKKLWDKLLACQQEAKGLEMTQRDRNALRLNFNEAFNALKANIKSNVGNRLNSRIDGLKGAIGKMEASIKRDKDNIAYQSGRINKNSTTQLEYQLRSAKLNLIEGRIQSKEQKLHNMYLTLKELEKKSEKIPKAKKVEIKTKAKVETGTKQTPATENNAIENKVTKSEEKTTEVAEAKKTDNPVDGVDTSLTQKTETVVQEAKKEEDIVTGETSATESNEIKNKVEEKTAEVAEVKKADTSGDGVDASLAQKTETVVQEAKKEEETVTEESTATESNEIENKVAKVEEKTTEVAEIKKEDESLAASETSKEIIGSTIAAQATLSGETNSSGIENTVAEIAKNDASATIENNTIEEVALDKNVTGDVVVEAKPSAGNTEATESSTEQSGEDVANSKNEEE